MTTMDTNVSNYTMSELMAIVDLNDLDPRSIMKSTTPFIDKFKMLRKNPVIIKKCPNINSKFSNTAEKIRNSIAHPEGKESGLLPIKREEFLPFIQWAEEFQLQLDDYVQINNKEGLPGK